MFSLPHPKPAAATAVPDVPARDKRHLRFHPQSRLAQFAGAAILAVLSAASPAQTINVGSTVSTGVATLNFTAAVTLNATPGTAIQVLTQGAPHLDFQYAAGGTCAAGASYTGGQSCTVEYSFTPSAPGMRLGAVVLFTNAATPAIAATAYLSGVGAGPEAVFYPGTQTTMASVASAVGAAVDGNGNVFALGSPGESALNFSQCATAGTLTEYPRTGGSVTLATDLNCAGGVKVDGAGNVYVADGGNLRIVKMVAANGGYTETTAVTGLGLPWDLAIDGGGNLYVAEDGYNQITKQTLQANGTYVQTLIDKEGQDVNLQGPHGIAMDAAGDLVVTTNNNNALLLYPGAAPTPTPTVLIAANTSLNNPNGVNADPSGSIYIADSGNGRVAKLAALSTGGYATTPTTVALTGTITPFGVALDASGNLYVSDNANGQLLKLDVADSQALPAFASTLVGSTSSDSPKTVTLTNVGNAALTFTPPTGSGLNPAIAAGFTLGAASTCPQLTSSSATATLAFGASCTDSISFTPVAGGPASGSLVTADNSLYTTASQTITLSGTGVNAQTITFAQPPTPVAVAATYTLNATATSGLAVTYAISGPATLNGTTLTYTGAGAVTITASQAGNAYYSAAPNVTRTVTVQGSPVISWSPSTNLVFVGQALGTGVLDATTTVAGTFAYTAKLLPSGTPAPVTSTSVLTVGSYTLTATFTPADTTDFTASTASIGLTVQHQSVFVANSVGTVTSLYDNGAVQSNGTSGGGIGAAVDSTGSVWSIGINQTSLARFNDAGTLTATYSGGGLNTATALAIDGLGTVWVANGSGTVSAFANSGTPLASTAIAAAGNISSPASVTVDSAGSLWIANAGNNTVTEVIGVAAAVVAPTAAAVANNTVGTRP